MIDLNDLPISEEVKSSIEKDNQANKTYVTECALCGATMNTKVDVRKMLYCGTCKPHADYIARRYGIGRPTYDKTGKKLETKIGPIPDAIREKILKEGSR